MRYVILMLVVLVLAVTSPTPLAPNESSAQHWPFYGNVYGEVYVSTPWKPLLLGSLGSGISALEVGHGALWVGTFAKGLYQLQVGGWKKIEGIGDPVIVNVWTTPHAVVVKTMNRGIWVSLDGGKTWEVETNYASQKTTYEILDELR